MTDEQKIEKMRWFINNELRNLTTQRVHSMSPTVAATLDVRIKEMNHVRDAFVAIFGAK